MKKNLRFDLLRDISNNTSLLSESEIQGIMSRNSVHAPLEKTTALPRHSFTIGIVSVITFGIITALLYNNNDSIDKRIVEQQTISENKRSVTENPLQAVQSDTSLPKTVIKKEQTIFKKISNNSFIDSLEKRHTNIDGMTFISLSKEELNKLGITINNDIVQVQIQERNLHPDTSFSRFTVSQLQLGTNTWKNTLSTNSNNTVLHPVVITYRPLNNNNESSSFIVNRSSLLTGDLIPTETANQLSDNDKNVGGTLPLLNQLVPIRITLDNEKNSAIITLWYIPEQRFISALPERFVLSIKNELQVHTDIVCKHIRSEEACSAFRGRATMFDICSSDAGAITQSAVYPNPAHGSAQCRYVLIQPRTITIALYTADGKFRKELLSQSEQSAGEQIVRLPLDDITGGLYLLSVSTTEGERIIQRLLIQ